MKFSPENLTSDFVAFRRAAFFGSILATTGLGTWLLWRSFGENGFSVLEAVQLVLFVLLFQQIATGFWLALFGFVTMLFGGDRARITRSIDRCGTLPGPAPRTAILLPIYNEDVGRVFSGVEAMWEGLKDSGKDEGFDFFILSDSNHTGSWTKEELAWFDLCKRLDGFGRIFYRKRRVARNGKSGNVADFCRRWGARYRYMVILDADSVMTGSLLSRLAAMMERNPRVGLIQTAPKLVFGKSPFRRMQQFATRVYAPLFSAGSNFWHLFGGNYWGHNAIIRVKPFMDHCGLPDLPEPDSGKRHILSHDTVEAALMRKAGFDVWYAYDEEGSYEEGPPNLSDSLARDRRWCQGNMQHFWFLFAPGVDFANRFHIWMGVFAYGSSVLWFLFLVIGAVDLAIKHRLSALSSNAGSLLTQSGGSVFVLLTATLALLFVPKLLSMLLQLRDGKSLGEFARMFASMLIETLTWTLLAPVMMLYYTRFVLANLFGSQVKWVTQNRSEEAGLPLATCLRVFWLPMVLGAASTGVLWVYAPYEIVLLLPILLGWLLAPLIAWVTSLPALGEWSRKAGLFLIPEENPESCPKELQLAGQEQSTPGPREPMYSGLLDAIADPKLNAIHVSMLREKKSAEKTRGYLDGLCERLSEHGPEALKKNEVFALLWDADSLCKLHRKVWTSQTLAGKALDWTITPIATRTAQTSK